MASTVAFSMELPTLTIEFFVSAAAFAGFASAFVVAIANGPKKGKACFLSNLDDR